MASSFPPLWSDARLPQRFQTMNCQELIVEYQRSRDPLIVVHLIRSNDGPKRRLTAILYNILGNAGRVEDFFQNLFIYLEEKLLEVDTIRNCAAWFARVVRNRAINDWKRERKRPDVEAAGTFQNPMGLDKEEFLARRMDARAQLVNMEKAVAGIELGWDCICLQWSGKSYTECAEALGLSFTQFRGRFQRAQKILSDRFGSNYEQYLALANMEVE